MHPYRTLYAKELVNWAKRVYWINEPKRNPIKYFLALFTMNKHAHKVKVYTPLLLTPTLLNLNSLNAFLLRIQLFLLCGFFDSNRTILWSVYCSHSKVIRYFKNTYKIYWPGDIFNPEKERSELTDYGIIMPLTEEKLSDLKKVYEGKTLLSQTGCDWHLFDKVYQQRRESRENTNTKSTKIVGYVGNLSAHRIDFQLIQSIANALSDITIELVGPFEKDEKSQFWMRELRRCANVKIKGEVTYPSVPLAISRFDVAIIPYLLNEFNNGTNPNKFYEYSAMGVPCISSRIPSLKKFTPYLRIADDIESWVKLIEEAFLEGNDNEGILRRIAFDVSPQRVLPKISNLILELAT